MDSIGKAAATALAQVRPAGSQDRHTSLPSKPLTSTAKAPALVDKRCDYELQRLFSTWIPDGEPRAVRRTLAPDERKALKARAGALRTGLAGYIESEAKVVKAQVGAMLGGFRAMRQQDADVEGLLMAAAAVMRPFPLWAIAKGCMKIAQRQAGLDPRYAPNDTEIFGVVDNIVKGYRQTLATVEALLVAPVETPHALPLPAPETDPAELEAMRLRLQGSVTSGPAQEKREPDGKHAERVAADLAARRKREEAA